MRIVARTRQERVNNYNRDKVVIFSFLRTYVLNLSLTLIIFHAKFQINSQLEKWLPRHYRRPRKKSELREPISVKHRGWNLSRQREKKHVNICLSIESSNFLKSFSHTRKLWKAVIRDLSLDQKQFQLTMHVYFPFSRAAVSAELCGYWSKCEKRQQLVFARPFSSAD